MNVVVHGDGVAFALGTAMCHRDRFSQRGRLIEQ